jgi:hypothetical protein
MIKTHETKNNGKIRHQSILKITLKKYNLILKSETNE